MELDSDSARTANDVHNDFVELRRLFGMVDEYIFWKPFGSILDSVSV